MTDYTERLLEFVKREDRDVLAAEFVNEVRITPSAAHDFFSDSIVLALRAELLAERLPPRSYTDSASTKFLYPASPWQYFKRVHAKSWWLGWLVNRRPVRNITVTRSLTLSLDCSDWVAYPHQTLVDPRLGKPVRIAEYRPAFTWSPDIDDDNPQELRYGV